MKIFSAILLVMIFVSCQKNQSIHPGEIWLDTDSNPINAHSGGILLENDTYYWYGEYKKGETFPVAYITDWECYRVSAGGVSCYSSKDLLNWNFEGIVLSPVEDDESHDLHTSKVIERPKVIYNELTRKYVMWMHIDSEDYLYARAGVAVSDSPTGPFKYIESMRPNGQMSRDMTLFKDDDRNAYHFYSSENNATMYISLLSDDYLKPSGTFKRVFIDQSREAPAVFRHESKYYIISSGCTGWSPNPAEYAVADSIMGDWTVMGSPCIGEKAETTFDSQSTFVVPVRGEKGKYIFMADRWNKLNLEDSRYVWLKLGFENEKMIIEWEDEWSLSD